MNLLSRPPRRFALGGAALFGLAWLLTLPAPAPASDKVRKSMREFAVEIKQLLDEHERSDFFLNDISSLPNTNPGPGITLFLVRELEKLGVTIKRKADFGFRGTLVEINEDQVELEIKIVNQKNKAIRQLSYQFDKTDLLPDEPVVEIKGTRAYAKGKYGLEILVGNEGRKLGDVEGMAFVSFKKNDRYFVKLINDADHEAVVLLKIDGINIFAFSEDPEPDNNPREYRIWVGPKSAEVIKGWYRKDGESDTFKVADYSDAGVGKLLRSPGEIGVITATFHACWSKGAAAPADEGKSRGSQFTDKGPPVQSPYQRAERIIGRPRATVFIRYDKIGKSGAE